MLALAFTTNEAVALFSLDERRVRKEVEHGVIGSLSPPRFTTAAIIYLLALNKLGLEVGVADRKRLFFLIRTKVAPRGKAVEARPLAVGPIMISPLLKLDVNDIVRKVRDRIDRFTAWKERLVIDDQVLAGEPAFPRSRLSVRHVGGMLIRGASPAEILEDYPYLSEEDLDLARKFTQAYPVLGRPSESQAVDR